MIAAKSQSSSRRGRITLGLVLLAALMLISWSAASLFSQPKTEGSSEPVKAPTAVAEFSHQFHLEMGASCTDCHDGAAEGAARRANLESCSNCHDGGAPLYQSRKVAGEAGMTGVIFSHEIHSEGMGLECNQCHRGIEQAERLTATLMPSMKLCMDCHGERGADAISCGKCHSADIAGMKPASHREGNWRKLHGQVARMGKFKGDKRDCNLCHQQSYCSSCHQSELPRSHTNQFRVRGHGLMAGINRDQCSTCHTQDTCIRCHQTTPPSTGPNAHRAGFGFPSNRHCVSCHQTQNNCSTCHQQQVSHRGPPAPSGVPQHAGFVSNGTCGTCHRRGAGLSHPPPLVSGFTCNNCHVLLGP